MRKIRSFSGDWYTIPDGQEHEFEEYKAAEAVIVENRREPVPEDVYDRALAIMMRFEECQTGWKYPS